VIVADCTVIARLIIAAEDPRPVETLRAREPIWAAPILWQAEFASVIWKYERLGRVSAHGADEFVRRALEIFEHTSHHVSIERALQTARRTGCSSYDSYYIALAEDLGVKLYTWDTEVLRKCPGLALKP
jgi:predicted nucleic acid-binding protein